MQRATPSGPSALWVGGKRWAFVNNLLGGMMSIALRIIVYPLLFVGSLFIFSLVLFPYDSLKTKLASEIEKMAGNRFQMTIGGFYPLPPSSLRFSDMTLIPTLSLPRAEKVHIEKLDLNISLLSLLSGKKGVTYVIESSHGQCRGEVTQEKTDLTINGEVKGLNLKLLGWLGQKWPIPVSGQLDGVYNLELYPSDPLRNMGSVELFFPELVIEKTNIQGMLDLPDLVFALKENKKGNVRIDIKRGNVEVTRFLFEGAPVGLNLEGKIYAAREFENYRLNINGEISIAPELEREIPLLIAVEKQKNEKGMYPVTLTGRTSRISLRIGDFKVPL